MTLEPNGSSVTYNFISMIFEQQAGFLIHRHGQILYSEQFKTFDHSGHIRYGYDYLNTACTFFFALDTGIDAVINTVNTHTKAHLYWESIISLIEIRDKTKSEKIKRLTEQKLVYVKEKYKQLAFNLLKVPSYEKLAFLMDTDTFLRVGRMLISSDKDVELEGINPVVLEYKFDTLPISTLSEWIITKDIVHEECLHAAMMSTDTNEELLILLRKMGVIKVGKWRTHAELIKDIDFKRHAQANRDKLFDETCKELDVFVQKALKDTKK